MADRPNVFRRVLESLVEGRSRSAQRYVETYLKDHKSQRPSDAL